MNKHLNKLNLEVTELETQVGDSPVLRVGARPCYYSKCPIPELVEGIPTLTQEGEDSILCSEG